MQEIKELLLRIAVAVEEMQTQISTLFSLSHTLSLSSLKSSLNLKSEEEEIKNFGEKSEKPLLTMKAKRPRKSPELPDELWIAEKAKDPAYAGLDVPTQVLRCKNWCEANGKIFSRKRVTNWLNGQEKPMRLPPAPTMVSVRPAQLSSRPTNIPVLPAGEPCPPDAREKLQRLFGKSFSMCEKEAS